MEAILFAVGLITVTAVPFGVWVMWLNQKIEHEEAEKERRTRELEALQALKPTPEEQLLNEVRALRQELSEYMHSNRTSNDIKLDS